LKREVAVELTLSTKALDHRLSKCYRVGIDAKRIWRMLRRHEYSTPSHWLWNSVGPLLAIVAGDRLASAFGMAAFNPISNPGNRG
jgi:hypothetical protein